MNFINMLHTERKKILKNENNELIQKMKIYVYKYKG